MKKEKQFIENILQGTGITINGPKPHDPQIHDERFYQRVIKKGSLGLGEAYMDGWWDCEQLDVFFTIVLSSNLEDTLTKDLAAKAKLALTVLSSVGHKSKAFEVGEQHYDIGNDLYKLMLDKRLTYTCGYWKDADTLQDAQENKLDLVCKKMGLTSGQKILDVGSGWGSFTGFATEKYNVQAVGLTISKEQKAYTDQTYGDSAIETRLQDYREMTDVFDGIVSLGMFEHVGPAYYRTYMEVLHTALAYDGLFLLHTIGADGTSQGVDAWTEKYIFPNGSLPSAAQITKAVEGLFVIEDWHNFGADYDTTLMAWYTNFESNWDVLQHQYDERFHRMWRYYLLMCAATFRSRTNNLWQIVLSKNGVKGGYTSIR